MSGILSLEPDQRAKYTRTITMNRRAFFKASAVIGLWARNVSAQKSPTPAFEPSKPGTLDIHHLAYGRGNSTFILCPDGTTILIDAGTADDSLEVPSAQKPNANIRPGEWIASYILREMQAAGRRPVSKPMNIRISWSEIWQPMGKCGREKARIPAGIFRSYKFCSNKTIPPRTCARWQSAASRRAAERFG
jgi:hypothetical protein